MGLHGCLHGAEVKSDPADSYQTDSCNCVCVLLLYAYGGGRVCVC